MAIEKSDRRRDRFRSNAAQVWVSKPLTQFRTCDGKLYQVGQNRDGKPTGIRRVKEPALEKFAKENS